MYGYLQILNEDGSSSKSYELTSGQITIGRGLSATIKITKDPDGILRNLHCTIRVEDNGVVKISNKSLGNPVIVNGNPVSDYCILKDNDELDVAGTQFRYRKTLNETDMKNITQLKNRFPVQTPLKLRHSIVTPSKKTSLIPLKTPSRITFRTPKIQPTPTSLKRPLEESISATQKWEVDEIPSTPLASRSIISPTPKRSRSLMQEVKSTTPLRRSRRLSKPLIELKTSIGTPRKLTETIDSIQETVLEDSILESTDTSSFIFQSGSKYSNKPSIGIFQPRTSAISPKSNLMQFSDAEISLQSNNSLRRSKRLQSVADSADKSALSLKTPVKDKKSTRQSLQKYLDEESCNLSGVGVLYETPPSKSRSRICQVELDPSTSGVKDATEVCTISDISNITTRKTRIGNIKEDSIVEIVNESTIEDSIIKSTNESSPQLVNETLSSINDDLFQTPTLTSTAKKDDKSRKSVKKHCVHELLQSPIVTSSTELKNRTRTSKGKSRVTNLSLIGVRRLMQTPNDENDLTDVGGVKRIFKTPKVVKEPNNDLTDVRGVRNLMRTPKLKESPDFTDNLKDVRKLYRKTPNNDLRKLHGVRDVLRTPKPPKETTKDINIKKLFDLPQSSPVNDLRDVRGIRKLFSPPEESPKPDYTNVLGVKTLFLNAESENRQQFNVSGVNDLFNQNEIFPKPLRTYSRISPKSKESSLVMTSPLSSHQINDDVRTWVENQAKLKSSLGEEVVELEETEDTTKTRRKKRSVEIESVKEETKRPIRRRKIKDINEIDLSLESTSNKPTRSTRGKKNQISDVQTESNEMIKDDTSTRINEEKERRVSAIALRTRRRIAPSTTVEPVRKTRKTVKQDLSVEVKEDPIPIKKVRKNAKTVTFAVEFDDEGVEVSEIDTKENNKENLPTKRGRKNTRNKKILTEPPQDVQIKETKEKPKRKPAQKKTKVESLEEVVAASPIRRSSRIRKAQKC